MNKIASFSLVLAFVVGLSFVSPLSNVQAEPKDKACWGQATKVFAQMGVMGEHSSGFAGSPRLGLRNLARSLYDDGNGPLENDTLQALGAYLNTALNLQIDACM